MHPLRYRLSTYRQSVAAPAGGASASVVALTGGLLSDLFPHVIFYVEAPAVTVGQLPNGETLTFTLLECSDRAGTVVNATTIGVQTGSGGAGAPAGFFACKPVLRGGQYFGLRVTASAGANVAGETVWMTPGLITDPAF